MRILYSETSSSGNCSIIQNSKDSKIIIDCGIKFDTVNRATKYTLYETDAMLLSHSHL